MYNGKRGQSLLVIVLLISVVFTLVATASYRFTTETQTSKLQEESVRTLAAADSGIELGLQLAQNNASITRRYDQVSWGNATLDGINKTASTIDIAKTQERSFVTSTIDKDEQYLFYLYDYPSGTNYYRNNFNIYYASSAGICGASRTLPALEMTLIYGAGAQNDKVVRYVLDPCRDGADLTKIRESETGTNQTVRIGDKCSPTACSVGGVSFNHFGNMVLLLQPIGTDNPKTLIVRVLFVPTILGFQIDPARPFDRFYAQGQKIQVKAVSNTGVSKVVSLFKSNPQIPADLFVTTF